MAYDRKSYETLANNEPYGCVQVVPNPFADQISRLTRDRANLLDEAVKAQAECERQRQAADWFAAERDSLKNKYEDMCDELAKQLALSRLEHAKEADELGKQVSEVHETNKELRTQLAESEAERLKGMDYMRMQEKRMRTAENELAAANEKLAALQPPAPTIVMQTWQIVWSDGTFSDEYLSLDTFNQGLTILRRDHYSDGTVKATLEQIGETK